MPREISRVQPKGQGGGGLIDPHTPVEVRMMPQLAPELLQAYFYALVLHATLYSTCSIVLHCIAGYTRVSVLVYLLASLPLGLGRGC